MKKLIFAIPFLAGLSLILVGVAGVLQLRSLATSPTSPDMSAYPVINLVAGDLMREATQSPNQARPAVLASQIQTRMLSVAGLGLLAIFASLGILLLRTDERANQIEYAHHPSSE